MFNGTASNGGSHIITFRMKDVIKETQNVLSNGGNVIKTRDDRELILIDKDGNIQNADSCVWLPANDGKISNSVLRTRIEP